MMMRRGGLASVVALSVALACASSGAHPETSGKPELHDGKYVFVERPAATSVTLEGNFIVLGDTVMLDATPGPCRYENSSPGSPIMYRCADITFRFDRIDPVRRVTYSFTTVVTEPKRVCARYDVNASGQRVCVETKVEYVDRNVSHTGTLRPQRADASLPPAQ